MATQSVGKRRRGLGQILEISVREVEALSESEEWVLPQVEAWSHGVLTLPKISKHHTQLEYNGLGVSLHLN